MHKGMRKKVLYERHLLLKDIKPYVDVIKQYFGLNHPNLDLELLIVERGIDDERTFALTEFITKDEVETVFDELFKGAEHGDSFVSLLWLVGNLFYGNSINLYEQYLYENVEDDIIWSTIEQELLSLYIFMQKHTLAETVTIKIDQETLNLPNTNTWVQAILNNHVFPNCLPKIHNSAEAEALLWRKKGAGAPPKHPEVNAIMNGIANLFLDNELIKERAPRNLCRFIKRYLTLMRLVDSDDSIIDEEWIKSQIHNFRKKSKDPRLATPEIKDVSPEELKDAGYYPVKWAFMAE